MKRLLLISLVLNLALTAGLLFQIANMPRTTATRATVVVPRKNFTAAKSAERPVGVACPYLASSSILLRNSESA